MRNITERSCERMWAVLELSLDDGLSPIVFVRPAAAWEICDLELGYYTNPVRRFDPVLLEFSPGDSLRDH